MLPTPDLAHLSTTQPGGVARRLQILRDGFDSRLKHLTYCIYREAADLKSARSLRSLSQLLLNSVQYILKITSVVYFSWYITVVQQNNNFSKPHCFIRKSTKTYRPDSEERFSKRYGRSGVSFLGRSNQTQRRQTTLHRCYIIQGAKAMGMGYATRYTLRRNTTSIIEDLIYRLQKFCITQRLENELP